MISAIPTFAELLAYEEDFLASAKLAARAGEYDTRAYFIRCANDLAAHIDGMPTEVAA